MLLKPCFRWNYHLAGWLVTTVGLNCCMFWCRGVQLRVYLRGFWSAMDSYEYDIALRVAADCNVGLMLQVIQGELGCKSLNGY